MMASQDSREDSKGLRSANQVWLASSYLVAVCTNISADLATVTLVSNKADILVPLVPKSTLVCVVDLPLLKGGDFEDAPDSEHQCYAFRRVTMAITQFL